MIKMFHLVNDDYEPSLSLFVPYVFILWLKETWKHFCYIYDVDEPSKLQFYVDGTKQPDTPLPSDISNAVALGKQIVLGDLENPDRSHLAFKGEIAHFHFWTKTLDESDIHTIKTSCLFPSNVQHFNDHLFFKWSVDQRDIDMHGSVSKIISDACGE